MASFLFICTGCLGQHRLAGRTDAPPDFDFLCHDCRQPAVVAKPPAPPKPAPTGRRGK